VKPAAKTCLLVSFLLCCALGTGAQAGLEPYTVRESVFLPPQFYVGDRVELRLRLQVADGLRLEPVELETEKEWLSVEEVRVQPRGSGEAEVRIFFVSFQPGTTRLPRLRLGDVVLADIGITTLSALKDRDASRLRGPRGQLALPGTYLKLAALGLAAIIVPALLLLLWRRLSRAVRELYALRRRRRPYLEAKKELKGLQQNLSRLESRSFFIRVSRLLKAYLGRRLEVPVLARTTRELAAAPPPLPAADWEEVLGILELSDLAKFSERSSPGEEMAATLARIGGLIERLEEERARVES
jgi:hypothetical protein